MEKIDTSKLKLKVKCDFAHCKAVFDNLDDFTEHWFEKHSRWLSVKATISERKKGGSH